MRVISRIGIPQGDLNKISDEYKTKLANQYISSSESIEWNGGIGYIKIYTDLSDYSKLITQLNQDGIYFSEKLKVIYTANELNSAPFLLINLKYVGENTYNGGYGKFFDEHIPGCRFYTKQHSDIQILKKDLAKRDIIRSIENEYLVSIRTKEILENEKVDGLKFRPVYTKKENELIAFQLIIENILPSLHEETRLDIANDDWRYNFKSYTLKQDTSLYFTPEILEKGKDFNITAEYFGIGAFPRPIKIVSQRVRQIIIKNKVKGIEFEPVFIIN